MNRREGDVFRLVLAILSCVIAVLLSIMVDWPRLALLAQPVVFTIRPTWESDIVLVTNPQNARDTSEYTAAGGAWGRICHTNCVEPVIAKATWQRIPGGYRPTALEVKWRASSAMALYGSDTAEIKATLEYNLGSGWASWKEYTWYQSSAACPTPEDGGITCSNHVDTLPLAPTQRIDTIQVRLTESVRLTYCQNCWIRVDLPPKSATGIV